MQPWTPGANHSEYNYRPYNFNRPAIQYATCSEAIEEIDDLGSDMNNVAVVTTIAPRNCSECAALYDTNSDIYLRCGHKLPVVSLAVNSHGSVRREYALVNGKPIFYIRDTGAAMLGISKRYVKPEHITDQLVKAIAFGGTVEVYRVGNIHIDSPWMSGYFQAAILPNPLEDLIIGNAPNIKSPTPEEIEEWYQRHGLYKSSTFSRQFNSRNPLSPGQHNDLTEKSIHTCMTVPGETTLGHSGDTRPCNTMGCKQLHKNTWVYHTNPSRAAIDCTQYGNERSVRKTDSGRAPTQGEWLKCESSTANL